MSHIFELAEELGTSTRELKQWLRRHGFGSGKTISHRATRAARVHFKPQTDHPMASALEEREGLGAVKRHEELIDLGDGIKVEERPQLKWSKVKRSDVDLFEMDMSAQRDFFKQLRAPQEPVMTPSSSDPKVSSSTKASKKRPSSPPSTKTKSVPTKAQLRSQSQHSIFGGLASMSAQLDSVTDRKRSETMNEQEALKALSAGVKPLNQAPKSKRKSKKKSKKGIARPNRQEQQAQVTQNVDLQKKETTFKELFERPEVQSLSAQVDELKAALKSTQIELASLLEQTQRLEAEREELRLLSHSAEMSRGRAEHEKQKSTEEERAPSLIWDHFESFGLDAHQARFALLELLDHPQRGPELIYSLKHDFPRSLTRGFAIVCEAEVCREVADIHARQGLIEVSEKHLCSVCQGSVARAWYKRLHLTATHTDQQRILVVGGDQHDHQLIKQLNREIGGLQWEFITGSSRIDQTAANAKVAHQSAIILWGGTHLPHSLSNVVKAAANRAQVSQAALPPGKRSVAYLCASILKLWGVELAEDLDIL